MSKYKGLYGYGSPYDFADKAGCINSHIRYMLARTQSMFKYSGLPETIPARSLELMLQVNGNVCVTDVDGTLYAFTGGMGGTPDVYYMPTIYTVANPALNYSKNLAIGSECCVVRNDAMYTGLMPLFNRYATALTENELSMKLVTVNTRTAAVISASDDKTLKAAEKYIKDIEAGKPAVIGSPDVLEGVRVQPYGTSSYTQALISLIEHEQYLKATWWNEIGLQANWNAKRESINSNESQLNDDMLLPLIDDMLKQRKEGFEAVNSMYGTNITVELASSWEDNRQELAAEQKQEGAEDVKIESNLE